MQAIAISGISGQIVVGAAVHVIVVARRNRGQVDIKLFELGFGPDGF